MKMHHSFFLSFLSFRLKDGLSSSKPQSSKQVLWNVARISVYRTFQYEKLRRLENSIGGKMGKKGKEF